jgi:chromosomal replication initiation ATPase DnaA
MRKTPERLLQIVALALDMAPSCYLMKTRTRNVAELRYIGALLLRSHFPKITLNEIATFFGGMDHSSIMSGMCRANKLICTGDDRFLKKYNKALNSVNIWLRKEAA